MKKFKLIVLYLLLIGGGVWHILDVFGSLMNIMASPLIMALGVWLFIENWSLISSDPKQSDFGKYELLLWSLFVIVTSLFVEALGVKTGLIFGQYEYGDKLPPYIGGVPLAIGFAWLTMLFSSISVMHFLIPTSWKKHLIVEIFFTALLMTLFDFFMEPAAIKLNYWNWVDNEIPFKNYLAWFLISFMFAWVGFQTKVLTQKVSKMGFHVYLAQLVYFILIYFS